VLRRYYEEFNETAAEGVDYAMLDGIAFFRDTLAPLESAIVAVFIIGCPCSGRVRSTAPASAYAYLRLVET
jgi:hypothetical protein